MTEISDAVVSELSAVAKQHPTFESWLQDAERLADHVWHKIRNEGDQADQLVDEGTSALDHRIYGDGTTDSSLQVTDPKPADTAPSVEGTPSVPSSASSNAVTADDTRSAEELTGHSVQVDDSSSKKK